MNEYNATVNLDLLTDAELEAFNVSMGNICEEFRKERFAQIAKWGDDDHSPDVYLRILGEEFGEACKAINDHDLSNYEVELIQCGAVVVRMLQSLYRQTAKETCSDRQRSD